MNKLTSILIVSLLFISSTMESNPLRSILPQTKQFTGVLQRRMSIDATKNHFAAIHECIVKICDTSNFAHSHKVKTALEKDDNYVEAKSIISNDIRSKRDQVDKIQNGIDYLFQRYETDNTVYIIEHLLHMCHKIKLSETDPNALKGRNEA